MDAEERHDLKTSELAKSFVKIKEWLDKYLNTILTIVAIVALAWAGYRYWNYRHEQAVATAWAEVKKANVLDTTAGDAPLDELRQVIKDPPDPTVAAIARLRLATGLAARADEAGGETRLSEAITELQAVIESAAADSLKAAALFSVATIHESKRDLNAAKSAYEQITTGAQFESTPFRKLAQDRLASLPSLEQRIEFLPGSAPPPPPPASAPATSQATKLDNAPSPTPSIGAQAPATTKPASAPKDGNGEKPADKPA
ncbi:MAG: tetratricopeptide repeat protein [Planctomycetes bacterium]|nr:tetratricopeptide repeat protein [Planctomycetota bacterium]